MTFKRPEAMQLAYNLLRFHDGIPFHDSSDSDSEGPETFSLFQTKALPKDEIRRSVSLKLLKGRSKLKSLILQLIATMPKRKTMLKLGSYELCKRKIAIKKKVLTLQKAKKTKNGCSRMKMT